MDHNDLITCPNCNYQQARVLYFRVSNYYKNTTEGFIPDGVNVSLEYTCFKCKSTSRYYYLPDKSIPYILDKYLRETLKLKY